MKIYLLYSNPYDEGAEIYGVFSTEEKVEKAREIFASKSNHELYVSEMEVDALEEHFERAMLPERPHSLWRTRTELGNRTFYGEWTFHIGGLDSFLERGAASEFVVETKYGMSAHVWAKSEEEAKEIVERMIGEGKILK